MYIEGMNYNQEELLAQGEKKAKLDAARNFYKNGASVDLFAKSIGFTVDEVKTIVGAN